MPTNGLYGHIQKNAMKSAVLLVGFVVLIALFWLSWCMIYAGVVEWLWPSKALRRASLDVRLVAIYGKAVAAALARWYVPLIGAASWLVIAYLLHARMIRLATGAEPISRREAPKLYNMVENLSITAGLPMPRVEIMHTSALNAYAAGLGPDDAVVAVTRGLMETLTDDELEAVIAHEITHIKNYDVRLMVVATVFAGGLTLVGDAVGRMMSGSSEHSSSGDWAGAAIGGAARASSDEDDSGNFAAMAVSVGIAILFLALTHLFAIMIKFALSRSREFMADAGAVELTKNPDALISALTKIEQNDEVPGVHGNVQAMMISASFEGLFSTHPATASRVTALERYAGGRIAAPRARPARAIKSDTWSQRPAGAGAMSGGGAMPAGAVGFGRRRVAPMAR